jgi:diaminohydroxyphosphoribosylaminopyrimidine deaminase/5-amino-6-(5-phosphoribosylamino)uracil reductase
MNEHLPFMERCFELAEKGLGFVAPNPLVGCLIVLNNKIIGEGFHQQFGEAHAEVNAINSVTDKSVLREATLYVNLEPCAHFGKTPPCANLIIQYKIKQVVIANFDPNPLVAGKGIAQLREAGIEVIEKVLEKEGRFLNRRFFTFHEKKRPYIILKWAKSSDNFFAPIGGQQLWLTGEKAKRLTHQWRTQELGILVGTHTALIDNPQLTARLYEGNNPTRIVIDKENMLSDKLAIKDKQAPTIIFNQSITKTSNNLTYITIDFNQNIIEQMLGKLMELNISSVIIEGGAFTINQFIQQNIWDEARVFTAPLTLNKGIPSPSLPCSVVKKENIGEDILNIYFNFDL